MDDAQDKHAFPFNAVDDNVLSNGEATTADAKVFVTRTTEVGKSGEQNETIGNGVDQTVSNLDAGGLLCNVVPNVIKVAFGTS